MEAKVRLENPETGGVQEFGAEAADWYKARGWVESDKPLAGEGEPEVPPELVAKAEKAPEDALAHEAKPSKSAQAKADKKTKE